MRTGIKAKIFLFTASLFCIVLLLLLVIQTFVIGQFYEKRQLENVEIAINDLQFQTLEAPEPERELYRLAGEFSMIHNTPFVVIDPEKSFFEQLNAPSNTVLVETEAGPIINLVVEGFDPDLLAHIEDGSGIEFSAFQMDEQNYRAFFLEVDSFAIDLESSFRKDGMPEDEIQRFMTEFADQPILNEHGEVILNNARNMDSQGSHKLIGYHGEQIERFLMEQGIESFLEEDFLRIYDFEDAWSSTHNRLVIKPLFFPDDKQFLLIAIISTANTDSTVAIFREFYWVNFAVALVLSFIATYIYAGRFSKPIVLMEEIAKDMADMNFHRRINISSKDEIGSLANSLNVLSDALQDKILALENANSKLTDEIEFKTRQEEIRKAFVANVSHELKTPITIMKGLIEGIRDGIYKDPSQLESALDEIHRMEHMVFDMLEISRYEAKGIELHKTLFSLDESIKRVYRRFKGWIDRKDVHVSLHLEESFIHADQEKTEQVLENLISNAIRYCRDKGQINIQMTTHKNRVECSIINDGEPIPEDAMESIWKPFYRVDASRNRTKGGTGLGLVIVKSILEEHHANFGVENTSEGVRFYFAFEIVNE